MLTLPPRSNPAFQNSKVSLGKKGPDSDVTINVYSETGDNPQFTNPSGENKSKSRDEWSRAFRGILSLVKSYEVLKHGDRREYLFNAFTNDYLDIGDKNRLVQMCIQYLWRFRAPEDADKEFTRSKVMAKNVKDSDGFTIPGESWRADAQRVVTADREAEAMGQMLALKEAKAIIMEVVGDAKRRNSLPKAPPKAEIVKPTVTVSPSSTYNSGTITLSCKNRYVLHTTLKKLIENWVNVLYWDNNETLIEGNSQDGYKALVYISQKSHWELIQELCVTIHNQPITTPFESLWVPALAVSRGITLS